MDFEQDAPASETDETGALDALHVPLLEDQEHDGSIELADDDVEMITMSDAESDGLKREADLEDGDESDAGDEASDEAEGRPHANGGPPSVDAAIQELVNDNNRLSRAVSSQHATIEELRKQLHQATTQLAATEQRLLVVSQDLAASRSFVAKEDVDGQQIRTVFDDLNEAVDDHTSCCSTPCLTRLKARLSTFPLLSRSFPVTNSCGRSFTISCRPRWCRRCL
ncbi:hypothetical protein EXIGLDRAFT_292918 [Exidia glandulosa HHB12029]|uniref:Uncharacterized protein n=1 Tax=Exidia glandulosa HHB12029 TaxID=1314781 RepID=A0A165M1X7_EXIGL|nr:hypothetical protein EXIGLDRAFT_292918 [Exidia glandulosa HHB12029]